MYKSEFCEVEYNEKGNFVMIKWEKFCQGEDYRKPLRYALEELKNNKNSNIICDARNGFEDEKEDVAWAFNEFMPQMAQTDCKMIVFITNQINSIADEIDMFTREFMKYVEVKKALSLEEAINKLPECSDNNTIILNVIYTILEGKRETFYKKVNEAGIPKQSRLEEGNLKYEYYLPVESENQILLIEIWKDQASLNAHKEMEHFKKLQIIKEAYIIDTKFEKYTICS